MPASQGTWNFIAADLLDNPQTEHSFVHDLESFFYVLLYLSVLYLPTGWDEGERSDFLNTIMDIRHFGKDGKGGTGKYFFMTSTSMKRLAFTSNDPFTKLVYGFKDILTKWYNAKDNPSLPRFEFRHEHVIELFNQALSSDSWPEDDTRSETPLIIPSISSIAAAQASSKRSFRCLMSGGNSSSSSKRRKPSPVT